MNRTLAFLFLAGGLLAAALLVSNRRGDVLRALRPSPTAVRASGDGLSLEAALTSTTLGAHRTGSFVTVEVKGLGALATTRAPLHLALVIDRSGSMHGPALAHAKAAALRVVSQLAPADHLSVVHYGSDVEVLPSARMQPEARARALRFVEAIDDDGGTNLGGGLEAAGLELARSTLTSRRMILLTDGRPTEGEVESEALLQRARHLRASGISLSAIGIGEDFNEDLLQALADTGSGAYGYLHDAARLPELFERDLQLAASTVARDVELRLIAGPGASVESILGARGERDGDSMRVRLPNLASGQLERVVASVSLAGASATETPITVELSWVDAQTQTRQALTAALAMPTDGPEAPRLPTKAEVLIARAVAAEHAQLAALALEQADAEAAREHLEERRTLMRRADHAASGIDGIEPTGRDEPMALQGGLADLTSSERSAAVKSLKREAQRGFGRVGSTY